MQSVMKRSLAVLLPACVLASTLMFLMPATAPGLQTAQSPAGRPRAGVTIKHPGINSCAACHFRQYRDWQSTPHGNAYKILPQKYKDDAECLECHVSKTRETAPGNSVAPAHALGVSCESCHGPGADHANYALSFVGRDQLFSESELKLLRSKIQKLALDQCVRCHTSKAHKPHPPFDREETPVNEQAAPGAAAKRGFFDVHGGQSK